MRIAAAALLLLGPAVAAPPKHLACISSSEEAVRIARTRGKLILLTVIIDREQQNRAVIDQVFRNKAFRKIAKEFVLLYANPDQHHGQVRVKGKHGEATRRCADCPAIMCTDHVRLAQNYARSFFPDNMAKTPIHFVLDAEEEVVATIKNGDFKSGFDHVPAGRLVGELRKLLDERGRGLTEQQYRRMEQDLTDAKAARVRENTKLELQKLLAVVALEKDVEGVVAARARVKELEQEAAAILVAAGKLIEAKEWEAALDRLGEIVAGYPGTLSATAAQKRSEELNDTREVKRLLKSRELYESGQKFKERGKPDIARKRFETCVRRFPETKYGKLCQKELESLGTKD